ncbi:nitric oxide synthase oxygenase [Halovenus salina]|uniref:Nitric oxide synthase oxygenase n=1 Tax=Halovenus salina TaxID=1510225 RepID=A0ABD5W224_9EURY
MVLPQLRSRYSTEQNRSLWKDETLVEFNRAVLHSFDDASVRIVDHNTATEQFAQFERNETTANQRMTGDRC